MLYTYGRVYFVPVAERWTIYIWPILFCARSRDKGIYIYTYIYYSHLIITHY